MLSHQRLNMTTPVLTIPEQSNIDSGSWFSRLSQPLRNAILSRSVVRRLKDGAMMSARGAPADEWCGVAKGAVLTHGNLIANVQQMAAWMARDLVDGKEVFVCPLPSGTSSPQVPLTVGRLASFT